MQHSHRMLKFSKVVSGVQAQFEGMPEGCIDELGHASTHDTFFNQEGTEGEEADSAMHGDSSRNSIRQVGVGQVLHHIPSFAPF